MAAEIKGQLGINAKLVPGSGGIFDVSADEEVVFSKQNQGNQFPQPDEMIERLKEIGTV